MKYLKQFTIILVISFVAEMLSRLIPGRIPGSIYGLVIMFGAFYFKLIKVSSVRDVAAFFIEIMPIFFIPAGVEILVAGDFMLKHFIPIITITFISTIVVIGISGVITQFIYGREIMKARKKLYEKDEK